MKGIAKISLILLIVSAVGVFGYFMISANASTINYTKNQNNASQTSWNETFTGNQNNTFWINIPKEAIVIDAKLNLSGYKSTVIEQQSGGDIGPPWCYSNVNNISETRWFSQSFIPSGNYLESLTFSSFAPQGMLTNISIKSSLTGNNLISKNTSTNTIDLGLSLTPLQTYFIVFKREQSSCGYSQCQICFSTQNLGNSYSNGLVNVTTNAGQTWGTIDFGYDINNDLYFITYNNSNSTNPYFDVSQNGNKDWQFGGEFTQLNNRTANFSSEIQSYLSTCTVKADETCDVPFVLHSDKGGNIQISDINITYSLTYPSWSNNITSKSSPQTYNTVNNYGFQINWTSDATNVTFQLGRPIGGLLNYTNASVIGVKNNTNGIYWINFTQTQLGGAGNYNYTWFANSTSNLWNNTDTIGYVISKATPSLMVAPLTTVTYPSATQTGCQRLTGDPNTQLTLLRNGTQAAQATTLTINETAISLGAAVYTYQCNYASSENYSAYNYADNLRTVSQNATNPINIEFYNTTDYYSNQNITANTNTWTIANGTTLYSQAGTVTIFRNKTSVSNPDNQTLPIGIYEYNANTTGNANYSANSTGATFKLQILDTIKPLWGLNETNSTYKNTFVKHSLYWTDNVNLSGYIFSFDNGTAVFGNDTFVSLTAGANWTNVSKKVNQTLNSVIRWMFFANDTNNNWNASDIFIYNTANNIPSVPSINVTPAPAQTTDDLNISYEYSDIDGDSESSQYFQWYINSSANWTSRELKASNTTLGDKIIASVRVYDGTNNSSWTNSSTLTIGDTVVPVLHNQTMSAINGNINNPFTIGINATEANSMGFVRVLITDPNSAATDFLMSQSSFNGSDYYFTKVYTPIVAGTYTFSFTAQDGSGNNAAQFTGTQNYSATVAAPQTTTGSGGEQAGCNIGYQLSDGKCVPSDIGFTVNPDFITVNVSGWSFFGSVRQLELKNIINEAVNISVRVEGDESREWIRIGNGLQTLKTLSFQLKPQTAFESGIGFLTYSVNAPANTTGTYRSKIVLQNAANKKEIVIPVELNISPSSGIGDGWVVLAGIGVIIAAAAALAARRGRKRRELY